MTNNTVLPEACLCDSGLDYNNCCGPFHSGSTIPSTALALIRLRFSAYVLRNADYLATTWDDSKRPAKIDFSKETAIWQNLLIVANKKGQPADSKGIVEFKAFYQQDGEDCFMHEISRFVKIAGRWVYLDGTIKAAGKVTLPANEGKNAPCSCGSGKKFKRCCGS